MKRKYTKYMFRFLIFFFILPLILVHCDNFSKQKKPNIVFISLETLRADHLEVYGYARWTAPTLARLASKGIVYSYALSQAPWTLPSVATMHTGLYPSEHGATGAETKIHDNIVTLAEVLKQEGYYTIGIASHVFVDKKHGLAQGFDVFDESQILGHNAVTSHALTKIAIDELEKHSERPFFLWIHYFDPHFSYIRHPAFGFARNYKGPLSDMITMSDIIALQQKQKITRNDIEFIKDVYDEEIAYTDAWIGELIKYFNQEGLDKKTIMFFTGDHGEYFMERGRFFHGKDVYNELVHVPLIISGNIDKNLQGTIVNEPVEVLSIPKTIMRLLDIKEYPFRGVDLLNMLNQKPSVTPIFTEGGYAWGKDFKKKAVVLQGWKLINNLDDNSYEMYNLSNDYHEKINLWNTDNDTVLAMKEQMLPLLKKFPFSVQRKEETIKLDEKTIERLRSLGYIK